MDLRKNYLSIRADIRAFEDPVDMFGRCRKCGCQMVILPDDRRCGFCFDCLDFLQITRRTEMGDGRAFTMPHENGYALH
ncbi:MAG: hypothetical protein R6W91_08160 [Thermoplasmata archaeon]